jgi:hypothetical protein
MSRFVVRSLLVAIACASLALAACGGSDDTGGPSTLPTKANPVSLTGGTTTLAVDPQTAGVLEDNAITLGAVAPARFASDAVAFPIAGGQLDGTSLGGAVTNTGGVRFASDAASVTLSDLRMDTTTKQVTAAAGNGRLPVFDLDQRLLTGTAAGGTLNSTGVVALLTPRAAHALNAALQVSVFTPKLIIGDLSIAATTG